MTRKAGAMRLDPYRRRGFECLCGNARMAARALTVLYDEHLAPAGITSGQLAVLWCVVGAEPVAMGDVARLLVMDKTTVSRNVAVLVAQGLVVVRAAEGDARVKALASTARGKRRFARAMPLWESAQAHVAGRMGAEKFSAAVLQTRRLARALGGVPRTR